MAVRANKIATLESQSGTYLARTLAETYSIKVKGFKPTFEVWMYIFLPTYFASSESDFRKIISFHYFKKYFIGYFWHITLCRHFIASSVFLRIFD